jgi:hypothetical protein
MTVKVGLIAKQASLAVENLKQTLKDLILRVDLQKQNARQQLKRKQDQRQLVGRMAEKKQQLVDQLQAEAKEL